MGFLAKILGVDSEPIAKLAPVTPSCCSKVVDDAADFREKVEAVLELLLRGWTGNAAVELARHLPWLPRWIAHATRGT